MMKKNRRIFHFLIATMLLAMSGSNAGCVDGSISTRSDGYGSSSDPEKRASPRRADLQVDSLASPLAYRDAIMDDNIAASENYQDRKRRKNNDHFEQQLEELPIKKEK